MSSESDKRQVEIIDRKSGERRLSEPVHVHGQSPLREDTARTNDAPAQTRAPDADPAAPAAPEAPTPIPTPQPAAEAVEPDAATTGSKRPKPAKQKLDIETFEHFIEYAYKRRGQRAILEHRVQHVIARYPRLDEAGVGRVLPLVNADVLLAVPRQILLTSRDVHGLPALRGALVDFVSMVMLRHPAFLPEGVRAVARNQPEAMAPAEALATVAAYSPPDVVGAEPLKPSELKELRRNATHLLATWLALHRGLGSEELSSLLLHVLWEPAAADLTDETARLRALTEIENVAGVGLVANFFRRRETEARAQETHARLEAHRASEQLGALTPQLALAQEQLAQRTDQLEALRAQSAEELAILRDEHRAGRMHQGHEFESLRGRMVQRLEESIETLEVGLTALRNSTPRISVMDQRAEVVLEALRAELNSLREG